MKRLNLHNVAKNFAATLALTGLVAFGPLGGLASAQASQPDRVNTQTAEIHLILTAVHALTSYNGDPAIRAQHLAAWAELWAEDSTFLINGTTLIQGKPAIMAFFANAPFFLNNWIGLTPSFRTEIDIHGNTAEVYLECIFLNQSETVVAKRALSGTVKKIRGQWRFWHMNNDPAAPLF